MGSGFLCLRPVHSLVAKGLWLAMKEIKLSHFGGLVKAESMVLHPKSSLMPPAIFDGTYKQESHPLKLKVSMVIKIMLKLYLNHRYH